MTNKKNSILKIASRPRRLKDRSGDMEESRDKGLNEGYAMPPRTWFFTFMCMNIPVAGWIYLLRLAFGKKDNQRLSAVQAGIPDHQPYFTGNLSLYRVGYC